MSQQWIECSASLPKNGEVVDTKIDDQDGCRNEQPLKRRNALWFFADDSMYVYYRPTHWKPVREADSLESKTGAK